MTRHDPREAVTLFRNVSFRIVSETIVCEAMRHVRD